MCQLPFWQVIYSLKLKMLLQAAKSKYSHCCICVKYLSCQFIDYQCLWKNMTLNSCPNMNCSVRMDSETVSKLKFTSFLQYLSLDHPMNRSWLNSVLGIVGKLFVQLIVRKPYSASYISSPLATDASLYVSNLLYNFKTETVITDSILSPFPVRKQFPRCDHGMCWGQALYCILCFGYSF